MLSKRLKSIADLVPNNARVIDIGTDHAYLPIYLYENNITKNITASDISSKVLKSSLDNLKKHNLDDKITLVLSDGLKSIKENFDVAIIAGMGTHTIKKILSASPIPNTLIIQSNNDHYELRLFLNTLDYKIAKEIVIEDKLHYYIIIKFQKGRELLSKEELLFGKSNNINYYSYLLDKYQKIHKKSQDKKYLEYVNILSKLIEKIPE